jgi:hypothetical protein
MSPQWSYVLLYHKLGLSKFTNTKSDVREYGFYGLGKANHLNQTIFQNVTIDGPPLNITAYYFNPSSYSVRNNSIFGYNWQDPRTGLYPFQNQSNMAFQWGYKTYSKVDMERIGRCQPGNTYKWGFSFFLLFIFILLTLIWTVGTYAIWLQAQLTLNHLGQDQVAGEYKAILEMAGAMQDQLIERTSDPTQLSEKEIRHHIHVERKGGSIPTRLIILKEKYFMRKGFVRWCRGTDKWWVLSLICLFVIILITIIYGTNDYTGSMGFGGVIFAFCLEPGIWFGSLFALCIGRRPGSSLLILLFLTSLGVILGIILAGALASSDD